MGNIKRHHSRVDWIKTPIALIRGFIRQIQRYQNVYGLGDFAADDLINLRAAQQLLESSGGSIVEDVALVGTTNPIVIPFTGSDKPIVQAFVKLSSDGTGKTLTNRQLVLQYDLTFDDVDCTIINSVIIYGNDDGTGHLNEDVYYRVQG